MTHESALSEIEKCRELLRKPGTMEEADQQAQRILELMTSEERLHLVCGRGDNMGINAVARLGIPVLNMADASAGIRIVGPVCTANYERTTAFPCPVLLSATWNPGLAASMGTAIGEECRAGGIHFLLGPGMNIYRISRCGRNFEYFGEDPYLAGHMASEYVKGLQSTGVSATIKHFACNQQELNRRGSNSIVSDRALREIYFPAFHAAIKAGAWAAMSAYNQLNGTWCGEDKHLITDILRGELGFDGLCMTDWCATWFGVDVSRSGIDIEMPSGWALQFDKEQVLGSPEVDGMARRLLRTLINAGIYEAECNGTHWQKEWTERFPDHVATAAEINSEGIVLLQNNGILPLSPQFQGSILVTGNMAERETLAGGGSARVKGYDLKSYLAAVRERFPAAAVQMEAQPSEETLAAADLVLVFTGFSPEYSDGPDAHEGECYDRPFILLEDALVARCVEQNPRTVVCVATGGGVRMEWAGNAAAIVQPFFGGQTGAPVLVDLLLGRINSSGKLPFTIENRFEDSPGYGYDQNPPMRDIPGLRARLSTNILEENCFFMNPDGTEARVFDINYSEDIFVGYRGYDQRQQEVRFPFGHGLSYTRFAYSDLVLTPTGPAQCRAEFTVCNTGALKGKEVVQLYVHDCSSSIERPPQELKAFAKVALEPGQSQRVCLELGPESFAFWHPDSRQWTVEPGAFEIRVGASSRDIRLRANVEISQP